MCQWNRATAPLWRAWDACCAWVHDAIRVCTGRVPDRDTWDLDRAAAAWLLPRLVRFAELSNAHPQETSEEEWDTILEQMVSALQVIAHHDQDDWTIAQKRCVDDGLLLLAKHWLDLWW